MTNNKYETRIVAYADILGWSGTIKNENQFNRLHKAVTSIADHANSFSPDAKAEVKKCKVEPFIKKYESVEFSYFSDSLVISVLPDYGEFLFKILSFSADALLHERFLTRGGVTLGDLYHSNGVVFGPALNKAVEIEQKEAMYPRFLCSQKLFEHLEKMPYRDEVILQDCCQEWVVNIACESLNNRDDLMKIIQSESHKTESAERKWRYMQTMLPEMFLVKSITY